MKKEGLSTLILCVLLSLLLGGAVGHFCFQPQQSAEMSYDTPITGYLIGYNNTKVKFALSEYPTDETYQLLVSDKDGHCKYYDVEFEKGVGISVVESFNKNECQFFVVIGADDNSKMVRLEMNENE